MKSQRLTPNPVLNLPICALLVIGALLTPREAIPAQLLVNGGFESPAGTYSMITNLPGWYVSDNIDIQSYSAGGWPSYEGDQSIDLSGCATNGAYIEQAFTTVPGQLYQLTFHYANNIYEGQECRATVRIMGSTIQVNELLRHSGSTQAAMDYTPFTTNFVADSWLTTLRFTHVFPPSSPCQGIVLDAVEVTDTPCLPYCATATATLVNGFVVAATVSAPGCGYTNTPLVRFIGGGGLGVQAVAVVSNGAVAVINVLNAGSGYTNLPLVVIEPPFIPNPILGIAPMSFLSFSNLVIGGLYQLQHLEVWYWSNQPVMFTATNAIYTQMVAGVVGSADYRLALSPVPNQAFATAEVAYGFVVHAIVTSGGSGYVTNPAISIVGGGGTNATAVSQISGGVITNITITSAGFGYTNTPTVQIAPPPAAAVPSTARPVMRVDSANLSPYDNYQIKFKPNIIGTWYDWNGGFFSPTQTTNSQLLFITNDVGYFRLQYLP